MSERERKRNEIFAAYQDGKLTVAVGACKGCPFFGKSLASVLAFKGASTAGQCRAPVPKLGGGILLNSPLPVEDSEVIPTWCPLRIGDVIVTVGE